MRRFAIVAPMLLASCGSPSGPTPVNTTEVVVAASQPVIERTAFWKRCEEPTFSVFGNKWWSALNTCEGDVAMDFESDSILLGGPDLRLTIRTPSCPAGKGAGLKSVDRVFFAQPFTAQLREIKTLMRQLLSEIDAECGGPVEAPGLLGVEFDEKFRDYAESWLNLSAKIGRKS